MRDDDQRDSGEIWGLDELPFLRRSPLPPFERRVVSIAPGNSRPFDRAEWKGALVVVDQGEIEVEGRCGACRTFRRGDILWFEGLPLRALHNHGDEPAVLIALSRQHRPT